jgi:uncharacterized phage protein (TIGR02220 family)
MRVNMDSSIVSDPRFKLVGMSLGIRHAEVIGCCYLLWLSCYERRSERYSIRLANACVDLSGFAEALIAEDLCTDHGDGTMTVHGVEERIAFLKRQAEKGAKGGKAKKKKADAKKLEANAKPALSKGLSSTQAYTLTPALTPALDLTPDKKEGRHDAEASALALVAVEELNRLTRRSFSATAKPTVADAKKLAKLGYTPEQVADVVCAKHRDWRADPNMAKQLKPSVLLRPSNFERYLAEDVDASASKRLTPAQMLALANAEDAA